MLFLLIGQTTKSRQTKTPRRRIKAASLRLCAKSPSAPPRETPFKQNPLRLRVSARNPIETEPSASPRLCAKSPSASLREKFRAYPRANPCVLHQKRCFHKRTLLLLMRLRKPRCRRRSSPPAHTFPPILRLIYREKTPGTHVERLLLNPHQFR